MFWESLVRQECIYLKMKDGSECLFVEETPEDSLFDSEKEGRSN